MFSFAAVLSVSIQFQTCSQAGNLWKMYFALKIWYQSLWTVYIFQGQQVHLGYGHSAYPSPLPNLYVEALTPNMMVFGDGSFGK